MKRTLHRGLLLFLLGACPATWSQDRDSKFTEARARIEKWVQTRQLIAGKQADWHVEKESNKQSIGLIQKELSLLDEKIKQSRQVRSEADAERRKLNQELGDLKSAAGVVEKVIWDMERDILKLSAQFPEPLKDRVSRARIRIPETRDDLKGRYIAERMQNVVAILNEVDRFNSAITLMTEVRTDTSGKIRQVQTLYLGIGQAFFSDQAGSFAGVGVPGNKDWTWTPRPELGERIRLAIDIYEKLESAEFVSLPVTIK